MGDYGAESCNGSTGFYIRASIIRYNTLLSHEQNRPGWLLQLPHSRRKVSRMHYFKVTTTHGIESIKRKGIPIAKWMKKKVFRFPPNPKPTLTFTYTWLPGFVIFVLSCRWIWKVDSCVTSLSSPTALYRAKTLLVPGADPSRLPSKSPVLAYLVFPTPCRP